MSFFHCYLLQADGFATGALASGVQLLHESFDGFIRGSQAYGM